MHGTQATAIQTDTPAAQPGSLVQSAQEDICVSLRMPARDRSPVARSLHHGLLLSRVDHDGQLPSRRDLDIPHTEASHAGADVGAPRHADQCRGLATPETREPQAQPQVAAGDTGVDKEQRTDPHLVGRRTIITKFYKIFF